MAGVAAADDDLPSRVGRVADVAGQLYLAPEERATEWTPVGINYPVTSGDNLWVEGEGRAEVDYGGGELRLAGGSSVQVSRLDEQQLALFVAQGRVIVRIRVLAPGESVHVDTVSTRIDLRLPGLYRIDVRPQTPTATLAVREGAASVWLSGMAQQALAGQTVTIRSESVAEIRTGLAVDGFDAWSAERDRRYESNRSLAYVPPDMVGTADLAAYGEWMSYPDVGPVWFPSNVGADWAPYSDGYWTSVGAFGPVWVDAAAWGYAPSHYGRWTHMHGRWGWCPGRHNGRPWWAPALVAWYGGPTWGPGRRGAPHYGWVPLGWGEPYVPAWRRCGDRCRTAYNKPYAVRHEQDRAPAAQYVNAAVPGAVTVVPGSTLTRGRPVAINRLRLPPDTVATAPVLGVAPPVNKPLVIESAPPRPGAPPPASLVRMTKPLPIVRPAAPATPESRPAVAPRNPVAASPSPVLPAQSNATAPVTPAHGNPTAPLGVAPLPVVPAHRVDRGIPGAVVVPHPAPQAPLPATGVAPVPPPPPIVAPHVGGHGGVPDVTAPGGVPGSTPPVAPVAPAITPKPAVPGGPVR